MINTVWHLRYRIASTILIFVLGFMVSYMGYLPQPEVSVSVEWASGDGYTPDNTIGDQTEVTFVYIGSSSCDFSTRPPVKRAVRSLISRSHRLTVTDDIGFTAIGVSVDYDVESGISHLNNVASFDEVLVGNSWANVGLEKYVWEEMPGPAVTPQIVIIRRNVSTPNNSNGAYRIQDEEVVARIKGSKEIRNADAKSLMSGV